MYQGRVYALTKEAANGKYKGSKGQALRFPYLYDTALSKGYKTIHPNCRHRLSVLPARAYTAAEMEEFSRRSMQPFEDVRSDKERKAYAEEQAIKRKRNESRRQYEKIKAALPNDAPKTFAGFVRMKAANSERYKELLRDYRTVTRVEKSAESGIIKEKSKKPITKISDKAIESVPNIHIDGYTEEQCIEIQKQHKELLEYSRTHNDDKEVAFVFRKGLTDRTEFIGEDDKLDFGTGMIGKGNDLLVMHNHPRNGSYSTTDIDFFGANDNVRTLSIVKNNGKIEILTKGDDFDIIIFRMEYNRLYKKIVKNNTDAEKDKFVKSLLSKSKSGVIWIES